MNRERIGLIAGWGKFPIIVAKALNELGFDVFCLGIKDHADPILSDICCDFRTTGVARIGGQVRYFRRNRVNRATMAGKIFKNKLLYHGLGWVGLFPDWRTICVGLPYFITNKKDRKDDTLLNAFVRAYAEDGIHFGPATDFAPELLVKHGILTRRQPSSAQWRDIKYGFQVAKEMGRMDIGQTVVIRNQTVVAVEAIEGTDECIRRAGELCPRGGFTVVKVAKPQQDMRFDVPTIGVGTLERIVEAGGSGLAIEADKTIVIEENEVSKFADRHKLSLVAVNSAELAVAEKEAA